jgi:hypothetical protein
MKPRRYQVTESLGKTQADLLAVRRSWSNCIGHRFGPAIFAFAVTSGTRSTPAIAQPMAAPRSSSQATPTGRSIEDWTYYGLSKWHVDKRDPDRSIPTAQQRDANPLEYGYFLMDVSDLAEGAIKRGNHLEAIKYYKTLTKAVPERAVSYRKVCISYQALGDWQSALTYCAIALTRAGTLVEDFERYARITLDMKPTFTPQDGEQLDAVAEHLRAQFPKATLADEMVCETGLKLQDNKRMKQCTDRLAASAPKNARTLTYQWAYALQRGDAREARQIIDKARQQGVPAAAVQNMVEGTDRYINSTHWSWLRNRTTWVGLILLVFAGWVFRSVSARRRLNAETTKIAQASQSL